MCEGNRKVMGKGKGLGNKDRTKVRVQDELWAIGFREKT